MSSMLARIDSHWFSASLLPPATLPPVPDVFVVDFESPPQPAATSSSVVASSRRRRFPKWDSRRTARGACLLLSKYIVIRFSWWTRNHRHPRLRVRIADGAVV